MDDFRGGFEKGPWWQRLNNGYNGITWMVVLNLGSTGLLVSCLMKGVININGHAADNDSLYNPLQFQTTSQIASAIIPLPFVSKLKLFLGIIVCIMSVHMYFAPPNMLVDLPVPVKAVPEDVVEVSVDRKLDYKNMLICICEYWLDLVYKELIVAKEVHGLIRTISNYVYKRIVKVSQPGIFFIINKLSKIRKVVLFFPSSIAS
ncbi:hypothetical protein POM88_032938 [Heracleum sosnowskyi]|uniref:Uncharacterized protein n=1 Tax=Heracleum sosnowskyi TaxID=360622 RepID=A0AAD8I147_9APIA|nr:hypothetical protein POM88_032938 [Heracleum sosnowskyi]